MAWQIVFWLKWFLAHKKTRSWLRKPSSFCSQFTVVFCSFIFMLVKLMQHIKRNIATVARRQTRNFPFFLFSSARAFHTHTHTHSSINIQYTLWIPCIFPRFPSSLASSWCFYFIYAITATWNALATHIRTTGYCIYVEFLSCCIWLFFLGPGHVHGNFSEIKKNIKRHSGSSSDSRSKSRSNKKRFRKMKK